MNHGDKKTALITGGTRGIGAAIARTLADNGYQLALNGRHLDEEAKQLVTELSLTTPCAFHGGDIADPLTCHQLVDQAYRRFGRLDALIHSAGGACPGTVLDVDAEKWMHAFAVHVHAVFHLFRAAHPHLANRGGAVLLISSAAGLRGCPGTVAYQTVKGALPQMARALARDHAHEDIRVNAVAPGIIETRFHAAMSEEARQNSTDNRIPLRRFGDPEHVASASVELLTNPFITGETLVVDGGMTMRMV